MNKNYKYFFENAFSFPNLISLFRLLLAIPVFFIVKNLHTNVNYRYITLTLILTAFISDLIDGYVARKKNLISEFGKIIDPLADKVFIFLLVTQLYLIGEILPLYFWTIVIRDIIIFIGGIYITRKIGKVLPSNLLGKITVLIIGIFILITISGMNKSNFIYHSLFYLSIILSLLSVIGYGLRGYEALKWNKNENSR